MNILVVSQYYYPEPFRINEICEELARRNNKVTVLTCNPNYPDGEIYEGYQNKNLKEIINNVIVHRCKCRPRHKGAFNLGLNYIDFVRQVNKLISSIDGYFDCIYVYQLSPITSCLPAIKFKKKNQIPIFLYCLDLWPESLKGTALGNAMGMLMFGALSKYIYKSADKIAVTSPSFKKYISKLCNIDEQSIECLTQHSAEIDITEINVCSNNEDKVINFVFMGNIGEAQNIECLLYAIKRIKDRSKFRFHIVGSGSHYDKCVSLSKELELNNSVVFHGRHPKSDMPKFYSIADVCYVSLRDEGIVGCTIPGKVQEYMSAGKPILACMNGDTPQLIQDALCGICVSAGDDLALSEAIIKMINLESKFDEMGKNSKKYFEQYFTLSSHVDKLEKMLGELIK